MVLLMGIIAFLPIAIVVFLYYAKWKKLKVSLIENSTTSPEDEEPSKEEAIILREQWKNRLRPALEKAINNIRQDSDGVLPLKEKLRGIADNVENRISERSYQLMESAFETGRVHSQVFKMKEAGLYILLFPGKNNNPSSLKRYEGFSNGWVKHFDYLHHLLKKDNDKFPLVVLSFFVNPDKQGGTLHLAYQDDNIRWFPAQLLSVSEKGISSILFNEVEQKF